MPEIARRCEWDTHDQGISQNGRKAQQNGPATPAIDRKKHKTLTISSHRNVRRKAHHLLGQKIALRYPRAYQAELRAALLDEVSPADVRAILRQVIRIAKRGHLPAVELLLKWVLGAPPIPVDPDRLDEHELDVRRKRPTLIDELALADDQAED